MTCKISEALSFLSSVIRSGEPFTEEVGMAIAGARDQLAALKEENERLKKQIEHDSHATELGNTWLRDSSLETWFPYTREEIDSLKAKIAELEKDSK